MSLRFLIASVVVLALIEICSAGGGGGGHKKVIIHVPFKVKHIHHTRTIVKHVGHEGGGGGEDYKVIGYSGGIDDGEVVAHGHSGGGGGDFGHGGGWESSIGGIGGGHGIEIGHAAALHGQGAELHAEPGIGGGHGPGLDTQGSGGHMAEEVKEAGSIEQLKEAEHEVAGAGSSYAEAGLGAYGGGGLDYNSISQDHGWSSGGAGGAESHGWSSGGSGGPESHGWSSGGSGGLESHGWSSGGSGGLESHGGY